MHLNRVPGQKLFNRTKPLDSGSVERVELTLSRANRDLRI